MNTTVRQVINQFRKLGETERQEVLKTLNQEKWETEWDRLDTELPDVAVSMADIVAEVKSAHRERPQTKTKAKAIPHHS